jgi:uncharacterized protein (TIGR02391 family)
MLTTMARGRTLMVDMTDNPFPSDPGKLKDYFAAFVESINTLRVSAGMAPLALSLFTVADGGYFAWILADAQSGEFKDKPVDLHVLDSPGQVQVSLNNAAASFQMRGDFVASDNANRRQAATFGTPQDYAGVVAASLNLRRVDAAALLAEENDLKQYLFDKFVSERNRRSPIAPADAGQRLVYLRLLEKGAVEERGPDQFVLSWSAIEELQALAPTKPVEVIIALEQLQHLHADVATACGRLAADGHLRQALTDAFIALDVAVQKKSGLKEFGDALMNKAFGTKTPPLRLSDDDEEQSGFMFLFKGAVKAIRNRYTHKLINPKTPVEALEWLAFSSALHRLVDDAQVVAPSVAPPPPVAPPPAALPASP